jgi:hypothetical protein
MRPLPVGCTEKLAACINWPATCHVISTAHRVLASLSTHHHHWHRLVAGVHDERKPAQSYHPHMRAHTSMRKCTGCQLQQAQFYLVWGGGEIQRRGNVESSRRSWKIVLRQNTSSRITNQHQPWALMRRPTICVPPVCITVTPVCITVAPPPPYPGTPPPPYCIGCNGSIVISIRGSINHHPRAVSHAPQADIRAIGIPPKTSLTHTRLAEGGMKGQE